MSPFILQLGSDKFIRSANYLSKCLFLQYSRTISAIADMGDIRVILWGQEPSSPYIIPVTSRGVSGHVRAGAKVDFK